MSETRVPALQPLPDQSWSRNVGGVRTRRILGFLIDGAIILGLTWVFGAFMVVLAIPTFGLSFGLAPLIPFIGVLYNGLTVSGPKMSTWGMRMVDLKVTHRDGARPDFIIAAGHAFLFWLLNGILTPLVLFVTFFNEEKRTLHDLLTGLVVSRTDQRG